MQRKELSLFFTHSFPVCCLTPAVIQETPEERLGEQHRWTGSVRSRQHILVFQAFTSHLQVAVEGWPRSCRPLMDACFCSFKPIVCGWRVDLWHTFWIPSLLCMFAGNFKISPSLRFLVHRWTRSGPLRHWNHTCCHSGMASFTWPPRGQNFPLWLQWRN